MEDCLIVFGHIMICNICGSNAFGRFNARLTARCVTCNSLERHRVCFAVYTSEGILTAASQLRRILHFAPEELLYNYLNGTAGNHYLCSDIDPEIYSFAQPLRLRLPEDLDIFPDEYFDFLLHNHVWEHIPGDWKGHIAPFMRILKPGGKMIFTIPFGPWCPKITIQGGEMLLTDAERLKLFGQNDHVRLFGHDILEYLPNVPGFEFSLDNISEEVKRGFGGFVNNDYPEIVFILKKLPSLLNLNSR